MLYKHIRASMYYLTGAYHSSIYFGYDTNDLRLLQDTKTYIDYAKPFGLKNFPNKDYLKALPYVDRLIVEFFSFWLDLKEKIINNLFRPVKSLQLTEYEMVYLLAHALWNSTGIFLFYSSTFLDIPGLSLHAIQICEEMSQQVANELHDYYTYEKRLDNYVSRLVKMTKLLEHAKV